LGRSQTKIWKFGQIASDLGGIGARLGSKSSSTIIAYHDAASRQIGNFRATPPEDAFTAQNAGVQ
jgi:hypothetical protein